MYVELENLENAKITGALFYESSAHNPKAQSLKVNVGYYCIKEPKDKDDSDASNDHIILSPNRVGQN